MHRNLLMCRTSKGETWSFMIDSSLCRSVLLISIACVARSEPTAQASKPPQFEVTSIKPMKSVPNRVDFGMKPGGTFSANGITTKFLIEAAYGIKDSQLAGAPEWVSSERFDVEAKPDEETAVAVDKLPSEQRRQQLMLMLQGLLADRFKLAATHETKELPIYALVVAKSGPKLHESAVKAGGDKALGVGGPAQAGVMMKGRGDLSVRFADMDTLADLISRFAGRPVLNKTGLMGRYDFTLQWTPEEGQAGIGPGGPKPGTENAPAAESSGPFLFTAIQEQLGLKLEPQKAPMDVLVIQHVERPGEN